MLSRMWSVRERIREEMTALLSQQMEGMAMGQADYRTFVRESWRTVRLKQKEHPLVYIIQLEF